MLPPRGLLFFATFSVAACVNPADTVHNNTSDVPVLTKHVGKLLLRMGRGHDYNVSTGLLEEDANESLQQVKKETLVICGLSGSARAEDCVKTNIDMILPHLDDMP